MYRVIVVDDEPWSLIGMRKFLEYGKNRFEIIFETTDPVAALEKIVEERPELVFTDVRMPVISGIELVHRVRELGLDTDFVVFSGYAEFSYVQQALREGVIDYQLKPLEMHKAEEMLDRLYDKLEEKRNAGDLSFYLALRENGKGNRELFRSRFRHAVYQNYQAVTVYFKSTECNLEPIDLGENVQYFRLKLGPRKCIFVINSEEDKSESIRLALLKQGSMIDRAGIGLCCGNAENLNVLIKTSELAGNDYFITSSKRISIYREKKKNLVNQLSQTLSDALLKSQLQKFKEILHGLTDYFSARNMGAEDAAYLWNRMVAPLTNYTEKAGIESDIVFLNPFDLCEKFEDLKAMGDYWYDLLSPLDTDQGGTVNDKFQEMLHYIDHHYAEDLFLNELCDQFYINISYCCKLFRRITDMTFSQYITHLRIKKACSLIQNHEALSIADVCERVGYNDYFYFTKVFKKSMGCTPSEYKKHGRLEGEGCHA